MAGETLNRGAFHEGLKRVADVVNPLANDLYRRQEPFTGNFRTDILGPHPQADSYAMVSKLQEGLRLLYKATSSKGLELPNGEVLKVEFEVADPEEMGRIARAGTDADRGFHPGIVG